jgi:ankyrin repeat protein
MECQVSIADLLLDKGANIDASDNYQHTLCHAAAESGNATMLSLIIERGADINATKVTAGLLYILRPFILITIPVKC